MLGNLRHLGNSFKCKLFTWLLVTHNTIHFSRIHKILFSISSICYLLRHTTLRDVQSIYVFFYFFHSYKYHVQIKALIVILRYICQLVWQHKSKPNSDTLHRVHIRINVKVEYKNENTIPICDGYIYIATFFFFKL